MGVVEEEEEEKWVVVEGVYEVVAGVAALAGVAPEEEVVVAPGVWVWVLDVMDMVEGVMTCCM